MIAHTVAFTGDDRPVETTVVEIATDIYRLSGWIPDIGVPLRSAQTVPEVTRVLGNSGDIPDITLDYLAYSAVGWTIDAREDGTTFTNDRTGHGMVVSVSGGQAF